MDPRHQKYVYIRTFGCQMNEHDTQRMGAMLSEMGFDPAGSPEEADLILFNTCTIREKAHHKALSEIGRCRHYKKRRPDTLIGVCGCVAQQEGRGILERFPYVDFVFGPDEIQRLPILISEAACGVRPAALDLIDDPTSYNFLDCVPRDKSLGPSAFVSIMKGCNCACSYCIVPQVRGREVCRRPDEIVEEIVALAATGAKEVVLLGQNVNAYDSRKAKGANPDTPGTRLAALIRLIATQTPILRIRFVSPHPRDVDDDLIREYAENEKLAPHIHLPVQAGSNTALQKMRRGYTAERYLEIASELRSARTGLAITTDIIVGFSGETDEDFDQTLEIMRKVEFDSIFAFKYSPRPGTEAAKRFPDDVPADKKDERLARVLNLGRHISKKRNESLVGQTEEALVVGRDRLRRGLLTARLPDNRIVHFAGHLSLLGDIVPVHITKAGNNSLSGEVIR
jgi:tRNA-2-methylthio-N6-dimethylallyladenosine synthase